MGESGDSGRAILLDAGKLTDREMAIMKTHAQRSGKPRRWMWFWSVFPKRECGGNGRGKSAASPITRNMTGPDIRQALWRQRKPQRVGELSHWRMLRRTDTGFDAYISLMTSPRTSTGDCYSRKSGSHFDPECRGRPLSSATGNSGRSWRPCRTGWRPGQCLPGWPMKCRRNGLQAVGHVGGR